MRILVFGNRDWIWPGPVERVLGELHQTGPHVLIHGGCGKVDRVGKILSGADLMAAGYAANLGWEAMAFSGGLPGRAALAPWAGQAATSPVRTTCSSG